MGITGAALATAISFIVYNSMKVHYVRKHFSITPFDRAYIKTIVLMVCVSTIYFLPTTFVGPFPGILIKSVLSTGLFVLGVMVFKLSPEIEAYARGLLKRS
jgi:O-antigen/teichoic acid export membrane protein